LTLDDIADQRAYERERDAFRRDVIATKRLRRVSVGPVITLTFENRTTMRFQVQEMARAERMVRDEQIQHELDVVPSLPEGEHESQLTRQEVTSAVHYVRFRLSPEQIEAFGRGPVRLAVAHPSYLDGLPGTELSDATRAELASDLAGD
jgi:hypothetical protein